MGRPLTGCCSLNPPHPLRTQWLASGDGSLFEVGVFVVIGYIAYLAAQACLLCVVVLIVSGFGSCLGL